MIPARIVDTPSLPTYDLGAEHPFAADRQLPLFDLLDRHGLLENDELLAPSPATTHELRLAHTPAYIAAIEALSADLVAPRLRLQALRFGMGTADNPVAAGQHEASRAIVGGTLACVRDVISSRCRHAFNPAGGLHHAMPAAASGFCIYNDVVVGIREARRRGLRRVLYVDFDAHHGDGVEHAFGDDPSVLTISFHETPDARWPFTGRVSERGRGAGEGCAINVPLASATGDESWLAAVRAVLPPLAHRYRPELIVSQHGCDPHRGDPLADLCLTTTAMAAAARVTRALADELCDGRWVATGGGGYQPYRVLPRVWGMVWADMSGRTLPERLDAGWIEAWREHARGPMPETFADPPAPNPRAAAAARANERTLARLTELLSL